MLGFNIFFKKLYYFHTFLFLLFLLSFFHIFLTFCYSFDCPLWFSESCSQFWCFKFYQNRPFKIFLISVLLSIYILLCVIFIPQFSLSFILLSFFLGWDVTFVLVVRRCLIVSTQLVLKTWHKRTFYSMKMCLVYGNVVSFGYKSMISYL